MQTNALPLVSGIHRLFSDNEAATGLHSRKGNYHGQDCCHRLRAQHPALRPPARRDRSRADGVRPHLAAQRRPPPLRPLGPARVLTAALRAVVLGFLPRRFLPRRFLPRRFLPRLGPRLSGALFCAPDTQPEVAATNPPQRQNEATRCIACWHVEFQNRRKRSGPERSRSRGVEGAIRQHRLRFGGSPAWVHPCFGSSSRLS
jgi:hypothetical protein